MIERLNKVRQAAMVTRYHTTPTRRTQTVAEHSYGVAQLVVHLWAGASSELLKAALYHDLPEVETGDIPAPTKWANEELVNTLEMIEDRFHNEYGTRYHLDANETILLKFCDMAELVLWNLEEMRLGNSYAAEIAERGIDYLTGMGTISAVCITLLEELQAEYSNLTAQPV